MRFTPHSFQEIIMTHNPSMHIFLTLILSSILQTTITIPSALKYTLKSLGDWSVSAGLPWFEAYKYIHLLPHTTAQAALGDASSLPEELCASIRTILSTIGFKNWQTVHLYL